MAIVSTLLSILVDHLHPAHARDEDEEAIILYYNQELSQLLVYVRQIAADWQVHFDYLQMNSGRSQSNVSFKVRITRNGGPGRPKFSISREQLEYLSSMSFSWTHIAQILGVSRMTIYRRRVEYNLLVDPSTSFTEDELKAAVITLRRQYPEIGETMVCGHLRSLGVRVARERVRNALRNSDPLSSALRWKGTLTRRRPYSVPGPNSLWHIGKFLANLLTSYPSDGGV